MCQGSFQERTIAGIPRRFEVLDHPRAGEEQAGVPRAPVALGWGEARTEPAGFRLSRVSHLILDRLALPSSGHWNIVDALRNCGGRRREGYIDRVEARGRCGEEIVEAVQ